MHKTNQVLVMKDKSVNSATSSLHLSLRTLILQLRVMTVLQGSRWGLVTGLLVVSIMGILSRYLPIWRSDTLLRNTLWSSFAGLMIGAFTGMLRFRSMRSKLRFMDKHLKLDDRLTTAWEISHHIIETTPQLAQVHFEDTVKHIQSMPRKGAFPLHPTRASLIIVGALMMLITLLVLVPNPQDIILEQRDTENLSVAKAKAVIEQSQDSISQNTEVTSDQIPSALAILDEALRELSDNQLSFTDKQAELIRAEDALDKLRSPTFNTFENNVSDFGKSEYADFSQMNTIVSKLIDAMISSDFAQMAAELDTIADLAAGSHINQNEMQALSEILAYIAQALQDYDQRLADTMHTAATNTLSPDSHKSKQALEQASDVLAALSEDKELEGTLSQAQASIQQANQLLRQTLTPGQNSGTLQSTSNNESALGSASQLDGASAGTGDGFIGEGSAVTGDDVNDSTLGTDRLTTVGGEITLPRNPNLGEPVISPGSENTSGVDYHAVYGEYSESARATLGRQVYPPHLRDYIRDYFSSLDW